MTTLTRSTKPYKPGTLQAVTVDATGKPIGRLATEIATYLRGKHLATFTPNQRTGVKVLVTNASLATFNPTALRLKKYRTYTGHPGGARYESAAEVLATNPAKAIRLAVSRMLPRNHQRAVQMRRLTITK